MRPVQNSDLTMESFELSCQTTDKTNEGQQLWLERAELAKDDGETTRRLNAGATEKDEEVSCGQGKESLSADELTIGHMDSSAGKKGGRTPSGRGQHHRVHGSHLETVKHGPRGTARTIRRTKTRHAREFCLKYPLRHRPQCESGARASVK
jgi:hypothetical protein